MTKISRFAANNFTLIEMMVILIIIAVMASIAAPQLGNFYQGMSMSSTVRRFRLFLDTARTQAALNNTHCRVVIEPGWRNIRLEIRRNTLIKNPSEAVKYIEQLDQNIAGRNDFVPLEGELSHMELPAGVNFKYIAIAGGRKASIQRLVITFSGFNEPDDVKFVLENSRHDYSGLHLEAGSGMVRDLQVINEDR